MRQQLQRGVVPTNRRPIDAEIAQNIAQSQRTEIKKERLRVPQRLHLELHFDAPLVLLFLSVDCLD